MGRLFRQTETLEVDGYRIERQVDKKPRPDGNGHYDTKTYTFSRAGTKNARDVKETTDKHVPNNGESKFAAKKQPADPPYPTATGESHGGGRVSFVRHAGAAQDVGVGIEQVPGERGKV